MLPLRPMECADDVCFPASSRGLAARNAYTLDEHRAAWGRTNGRLLTVLSEYMELRGCAWSMPL